MSEDNPYEWTIDWSGGQTWTPVTISGTKDQIEMIKLVHDVKLFGNWIARTKELQEEWYGQKFEEFTHEQLVDWIRINVLAAEDELHEALSEISWKPWASAEFFNREAYLGEIVDVLHFVGNLLAGAGITDQELNDAYYEKMNRNIERQKQGYTGTDKCVGCKRASDDVTAHGGTITQDDEGESWCSDCWQSIEDYGSDDRE